MFIGMLDLKVAMMFVFAFYNCQELLSVSRLRFKNSSSSWSFGTRAINFVFIETSILSGGNEP